MKIAIIDKAPSRNDYKKYFDFEFDLFHMSSVPLSGKLLKKDVDLEIDLDEYGLVILVGSEAAKEYAKISSITNYAGQLIKEKFIPITNPSVLIFKPEGKEEFNRSIDKIKKYVAGEIRNGAAAGDFKGVDNEAEALAYLREVLENAEDAVALDTETTALYPRDGHVLGICVSYQPYRGRYILSDVFTEEAVELLQAIVNKFEIVFHNMKFDYKMIEYHFGIKFRPEHSHDTMVMHYILDENSPHGLKPLAIKYTDLGDYDSELSEFIANYCHKHGVKREDFTWDLIPFDIISKYAAIDPTATLMLYRKFKPLIDNNDKFSAVYYNILRPGTIFLHEMEEVGIPISRERMQAADEYLTSRIKAAEADLYRFDEVKLFEQERGVIFNPNSVQQLRVLLFDYLKLTPTGKLTATGALSTDAEVLEELSEQHPLPEALLNIRRLGKIQNTYISKILPELDRDGRIRTNFNLIFTTSGRLSSSGKFNAQQIPRDDPIIKGCIVAPPGYKIVSQDLQTGEMYYAAVLSGDKNLQSVFSSGGDFHSSIAKMVFDLDCEVDQVKHLYKEMRQSAKAISFGILYGSGPKKVSETVSKATGQYYGLDRAKDDIDAYFTKFKKLKEWLNSREKFIRAHGYTYSFFGRKRRLLNVFSEDKGVAAGEVRSGINSEIQSICSDVNFLAAMDTHRELKLSKAPAKIFMLVHDSIVALVREDFVDDYRAILKRNTQKDRGCSIPGTPIGIDQEVGDDYSFGKFDEYYRLESGVLSRV